MPMINLVFRMTSEEAASLKAEVAKMKRRKKWRTSYTVSDFIRDAIGEKLDHIERSRKAVKRRDEASKLKASRDEREYAEKSGIPCVDDVPPWEEHS